MVPRRESMHHLPERRAEAGTATVLDTPGTSRTRDMRFYDKDWKFIGTKMTQVQTFERIIGKRQLSTGKVKLEKFYSDTLKTLKSLQRSDWSRKCLQGPDCVLNRRLRRQSFLFSDGVLALPTCIATKMSWMAGRTTTRVEDVAYSMLGIFNVYMTTQYGEGVHAFMRLQQALLSASRDESLFAWKMPSPAAGMRFIRGAEQDITWEPVAWGLLAASPGWFGDSARVTTERPPDIIRLPRGFAMAQAGIAVQIPLAPPRLLEHLIIIARVGLTLPIALRMYRSRCRKDFEYPLKCSLQNEAGGQTPVRIYLRPVSTGYKRIRSWEFGRGDTSKHLRTLKRTEEGIVFQPTNGYLD
ncbi:hypothetical protein NPX13_g1226 [Xylaria arbuscula]|uniref:Uncharacterized protein n=1 Tax=Xylaria arbuscula TaxID=114810 RepID=A0A9W8TRZ3_9PEZI|nr:hypothetical protein NPX13_g1226 [Xylaria arbuscula]